MSLLLAPLREVSIDRHNRAIQALKNGSLSVTLTYRSEAEIRAFVRSSDNLYYVNLLEAGAICSCPDALHRGVVCKHAIAVVVTCLQQLDTIANRIHFWLRTDALPLCGEEKPQRFLHGWFESAANWSDVCPRCRQTWQRPASLSRDEHFYQEQDDQQEHAA